MKTIIAGSRGIGLVPAYPGSDILVQGRLDDVIDQCVAAMGITVTEVVSGTAKGVDTAGELWAKLRGIPIKRFPADWTTHGRRAGPIRNGQMASYVDRDGALIAIWDGKSRGTKHMIEVAQLRGMKVHIEVIER